MYEVIIGIVIFLCFLLIIITVINNRFKLAIIKIEKAEEDINIYLQKKKELLDRTKPIINKELKIENFLNEIDLYNDDMSNFDKNDLLKRQYNNLFKVIDENEKLYKSEPLMSIFSCLNENEENVVGAIKFYNDTVVNYNKLVISFPSNIISLFKGYKKKEFYNNEKREIFEILNKK